MQIKPDPLKSVSTEQSNFDVNSAEEQLQQLHTRIESYLSLFKEMFAKPEKLHHPDFVPLELSGHELEVQAVRIREAIRALDKCNPSQAQELKELYDADLAALHKEVSSIVEKTLPALRAEIEKKFKELAASPSMNPSAFLDLQNSVQQFQLLIEKTEQELRRIQFQRLFE